MFRQWCLYQCDPYLQKWVINWTEPEEETTTPTVPFTTQIPLPNVTLEVKLQGIPPNRTSRMSHPSNRKQRPKIGNKNILFCLIGNNVFQENTVFFISKIGKSKKRSSLTKMIDFDFRKFSDSV